MLLLINVERYRSKKEAALYAPMQIPPAWELMGIFKDFQGLAEWSEMAARGEMIEETQTEEV